MSKCVYTSVEPRLAHTGPEVDEGADATCFLTKVLF